MRDGTGKTPLLAGSLSIDMNKLEIFCTGSESINPGLINLDPARDTRLATDPVAELAWRYGLHRRYGRGGISAINWRDSARPGPDHQA